MADSEKLAALFKVPEYLVPDLILLHSIMSQRLNDDGETLANVLARFWNDPDAWASLGFIVSAHALHPHDHESDDLAVVVTDAVPPIEKRMMGEGVLRKTTFSS